MKIFNPGIKFISLLFVFPFGLGLFCAAQNVLTTDQAILEALQYNYNIKVYQNEAAIAENDITPGNAGMLPVLNLNTNATLGQTSFKQSYTTGTELNRSNAGSKNANGNLAFSWTVFDGMKMFVVYKRLSEFSELSQLNTKLQVEKTIAEVLMAYYEIVRQKQILNVLDTNIVILNERLKVADTRVKIGNGSRSDWLQIKVDLNAQLAGRIRQRKVIEVAKLNLNTIMGRENVEFEVVNDIPLDYQPELDHLKTSVLERNTGIQIGKKNFLLTELSLKETRALRYPKIALVANYNMSATDNQAGFLLSNRQLTWNTGVNATWNLFNGFNQNRMERDANLRIANSRIQLEGVKILVQNELFSAWQNYQTSIEILNLEEENILFAKENISLALERLRLNNISIIDMKEAQKSLEEVQNRLVLARFEAKLAEIELMRLNGDLLKE